MTFTFTQQQLDILEDIFNSSSSTRFVEGYEAVLEFISTQDGSEPLEGVDASVWLWIRGALDVNQNQGAFATFIREYTSHQYFLRYGETLSSQTLQDISDSISAGLLNLILNGANAGELPSIQDVGALDAGEVTDNLFEENINAWSGVVLFPFLGVTSFLDDMLSTTTADSTYDVTAAWASFFDAAYAVNQTITTWSDALSVLSDLLEVMANNNAGLVSTIGNGLIAFNDADDFLDEAYDLNIADLFISDYLVGTTSGDNLTATESSELIHSGDGNDTIIASLEEGLTSVDVDVVDGGDGVDTFDASAITEDLQVTSGTAGYTGWYLEIDAPNFGSGTYAYNVEKLKLGSGEDEVDFTLAENSSFRELDTGAGDDVVTIWGQVAPNTPIEELPQIFLGSGNDTLRLVPEGSIVHGGSGDDTFYLAHNYLIADAEAGDRISLWGWRDLTGGIHNAHSDSPWAYGMYGERYAVNTANELVIRDWFGNDTYVANFDKDLSAPYTAGILLIDLLLESYKLLEAPNGMQFYQTMEALLGYALKALTGTSYFEGVDPLVLDLDGDGLELTARTSVSPLFDIDADGFAERTGWVRPDDGFLVRDLNSNGKIDDVSEMFGNRTQSGFDALSALDSNSDDVIDSNDTAFSTLKVWQDLDGDGVTDAGELKTLSELNIESIDLDSTPSTDVIAGNSVTATATFTRTNQTTGTVGDIAFQVNDRETVWLGDDTVDSGVETLPNLKGYGTLTDLHIAMTDSEDLLDEVETALPLLDTPDLAELRETIAPVLNEWAAAVTVPSGTPGLTTRSDVPILVDTSLEGGTVLLDFAYQVTDGQGTYWVLASGEDVLDGNEDPIARPTLNDVLAQTPAEGTWETFSGEMIQFMERRLGTELPLGEENNLTDPEAIEGAQTVLEFMWGDLNEIAVRLAMHGGLSSYFDGVEYDPATDKFLPTTNQGLTPMMEAILDAAPTTTTAAEEYLAAWKPLLDVFLQDFSRGEDYLMLSYGYLFQHLVAAYENTGFVLSIEDAAAALDIPSEILQTGSGTITGTADSDIFYLGAGNQTAEGGEGPDTYVFGANFGNDVIDDVEELPNGSEHDIIRFAHLNADDVTLTRDGLNLIISVDGTSDDITVVNQFFGQRPALLGGYVDDDHGIREIVFADGTVWDRMDIAQAVSTNTTGNDTITGTNTIDFLDGGAGNDYLSGGNDGDAYAFGVGDGEDTIEDDMDYILLDGPDIVRFKEGVEREDLNWSRDGDSGDLVIGIDGTSDELTILGQFDATYTGPLDTQWLNRIEGFMFDDGSVLRWDELLEQLVAAGKTSGNDTIYGFAYEDLLDGGAGNDYLSGGNEDDIYIIGAGYGEDTIDELQDNLLSGGDDTLRFLSGVAPANVSVSRVEDSDDLTLTLTDGTTVDILGQFDATYTGPFAVQWFNRIESFEFADETVWDYDDIMDRLIDEASTSGNDSIYGFAREDVLDGGAGDDLLEGGFEGDTYIFARGYGDDTIMDQAFSLSYGDDIDELHLTDIDPNEITVERLSTGYDMVIRINDTGKTITLKDQVNQTVNDFNLNEIEKIVFGDSTEWTAADLRDAYLASAATSGNDLIRGFFTADVLDGGAGDDRLEGGGRGDTYHFGLGYGQDTIHDYVQYDVWDDPDTVEFGSGITTSMVQVARLGDDLVLDFQGYADRLVVENHFWGSSGSTYYAIENFEFADTTVWDQEDIDNLMTIGTSGNDTINGTSGNNTLVGGLGNDTLNGGEGHDTYAYALGDGDDTINEVYSWPTTYTDRLVLGDGLEVEDAILTRGAIDNKDLTLSFDGVSGSVTINEQFNSLLTYGVEQIVFWDGTIWDLQDIRDAYLAQVSTSGNDTILGFDGVADTLQGGAGNDTITGGSGSDDYVYNQGDGNDTIIEGYQPSNTDRLLLGSGLTTSLIQIVRSISDLDDVTLQFSGISGSITLDEQFNSLSSYGVEQIVFAGGPTWSLSDLRSNYLSQASTSGNDTIYGFDSIADTINGGNGNDTIYGLSGNDTLNGGDGDDILIGGAGNDTMDGGDGTDTVSYTTSISGVTVNLATGSHSGDAWVTASATLRT